MDLPRTKPKRTDSSDTALFLTRGIGIEANAEEAVKNDRLSAAKEILFPYQLRDLFAERSPD
jgi:hypothetical protein